jgi:hypothetical protein
MGVSNAFLRLGVLALIVGVSLGMWMGANEDFTLRPIHAHINLIGWASMMLMGFFYRLLPHAAGRLAWIQLCVFTLGFILMMTGLSAMLLGNEALLPLLMAGELLTGLGILLFAVILFRATGGREMAPA